jgi:hydrogenase maturation factor
MCQANIGRVLEVNGKNALLFYRGKKIEVKTDLLKNVRKDDHLMFSSGIAIEKVSRKDADYMCGCDGDSE